MSAPPLTIHLFGPLRVLLHGEPMPRGRTRSVEWLLALLVLRHDRVVERSWLAGTLWPESEESQALHNLRDVLVHLRKTLGTERERLQSPTRDTLTLDLDGADVDVLAFDAAMSAGDEGSLQCAVALYTGPLLEGCFEAWVVSERDIREQACFRALEALADAAEKRQDYTGALGLLRRAEGMDALRDTTRRGLMRVLAASGDAPAALNAYREYRLLLREEMNVEPDEETVGLYQQIRQQAKQAAQRGDPTLREAPPSRASPPVPLSLPSALPHPLTALIGRAQETRAIAQALSHSRLVTLVGGGGVGKTRLAIQVARELAPDFAQGVAFVELAALSDPALLPTFVATVLGIREEANPEPAYLLLALTGWFSTHHVLLVLDNCEHLIEAAAALTQALLERCPDLCILATSRQRLGLTGEIAWRVPSLSSPDPERLSGGAYHVAERALEYPAVRLFVERAAMARPGFRLADTTDATAVARICHRLDGIPLAIELAAARVGALSVGQIASRLSDRFQLLTGGSRTVLPRQKTLRSLIDWSYDLLTEEERALLCRLSVFAGGWTLEAAEAIADWSESIGNSDVLDLLVSLVDKSLVLSEERDGDIRYRMLETVREYAIEKLRERGEEPAARARHAEHYLALAEQAHPFLEKPEPAWLDRLENEHDNLRAARTYFAAQEEQEEQVEKTVRLVAALAPFLSVRGHYYEQRTWLLSLAARPTPPTKARAELLRWAAGLFNHDEDFARAKQMLTECLQIVRQLGDQREIARALNSLAGLISHPRVPRSEYDAVAARALAEESLAIARELGDWQGMAYVLYQLGHLAWQIGDTNEARARWMECHRVDQELGNKGGYVLWALGDVAVDCGDFSAARDFFGRFMTERYEVGDRWNAAWVLVTFCTAALAEREAERAARLLGASLALCESSHPLTEHQRARYEALRDAVREVLGDSALGAAEAEGRAMTLEQAMRLALCEAPELRKR